MSNQATWCICGVLTGGAVDIRPTCPIHGSSLSGSAGAASIEQALADLYALGNSPAMRAFAPPCPACVSEYGQPDATCVHCGGSGVCSSAKHQAVPAGATKIEAHQAESAHTSSSSSEEG